MTQQIHTIESITSQQGVYLDNITVNGKNIRITIPAGIEDQQTIKIKGFINHIIKVFTRKNFI